MALQQGEWYRRPSTQVFPTSGALSQPQSQCLLQGCFQLLKNKISAHCIKKKVKEQLDSSCGTASTLPPQVPHPDPTNLGSKTLKKKKRNQKKKKNQIQKHCASLSNICRPFLWNHSLNNTTWQLLTQHLHCFRWFKAYRAGYKCSSLVQNLPNHIRAPGLIPVLYGVDNKHIF